MKPILFSLLLLSAAMALPAEDSTLGPDSQPQDGVPKGKVTKFVLPPGKTYPGTPHNCAVYVPAQYDASKPTPFMIFLDGSQAMGNGMRVPVVFDNLIAKHDLPPMIAIFVDPGILPVVSDAAQNRYNRIYEYDSLTPRFAEFLLNELIPAVAKNYNLSKNPDDRGLSGVSTGAVGAFMAAWNRPDQFHRVLSFIGTYVSMKGADALPGLVRKTEPKPIRNLMQDGAQDHIALPEPFGSSPFGSWPINNQVMFEALEFAGYDVKFEMGTGAHNTQQAGAVLPDALRWLWREYPGPIVVHEPAAAREPGYDTANRVFSTVYLDKPWEKVGNLNELTESLTSDRSGNVYFARRFAGTVERVDTTGNVTQLVGNSDHFYKVRIGPDDRLYARSTRSIVSWKMENGAATDEKTVATIPGAPDFVITRTGVIYFLQTTSDSIGMIDAAGQIHVSAQLTQFGEEFGSANGLALSPDQSLLVATNDLSRYSWSFQIAADGSLVNGEPFYRLETAETTKPVERAGAQAATEDTDGMVYFATSLGIQVAMQNGRIVEILNPPVPGGGPLTAITFSRTGDQNWLWVAQGDKLFRRPVKVTGANAWTVVKPPKPTL
ncbi:MAG: alpha/beta hydrolase-fold protein [Terracidiphilus sp.]|jgi:sugar lactone lactonase YvrE